MSRCRWFRCMGGKVFGNPYNSRAITTRRRMGSDQTLFALLSQGLEATLRDNNPWWRGERIAGLPAIHRWAFAPVLNSLKTGLAPITVLRGPRQVGKTTILNQTIQSLLDEGISPERIFRVQFDELPR